MTRQHETARPETTTARPENAAPAPERKALRVKTSLKAGNFEIQDLMSFKRRTL